MKTLTTILAVLLFATLAVGQVSPRYSVVGWDYTAGSYNYGNNPVINGGVIYTGTSATGSQTIYLRQGTVTLADGRVIAPYATTAAIIVGAGTANSETVTPSAVSGCYIGAANGVCAITATFSNTHAPGEIIASGTSGYQEAVNDAALNGGGVVQFYRDERVTLATGGTTTDTSANLLPANSLILGVAGRVTTTITSGCTGWQLGDATTAGRFTASDTTLTAGETKVGSVDLTTGVASATTGFFQASAAKVRITCATAAPGAGAVHVGVWGYTIVPPGN